MPDAEGPPPSFGAPEYSDEYIAAAGVGLSAPFYPGAGAQPRGGAPLYGRSGPGRTPAPARFENPAGAKKGRDSLKDLHQQIVIDCIAEPPVAAVILGLRSIFSTEAGDSAAAAAVARLKTFLESVLADELPYLDPANPSGSWRDLWRKKLSRFGMTPDPLIDEAVRQVRAGMKGKSDSGEYARALEHQHHREVLGALRTAEATVSDGEKERAAQQKLLARREFERRRAGKGEES